MAARRLRGLAEEGSVWGEFGALSRQYGAVNLGQGFPDWDTPAFVKEAVCAAVHEGSNQYAASQGDSRLRMALAEEYSVKLGHKVGQQHVLITNGATHALYCAMTALCQEGDEVVVFEPYFELYRMQVAMCGATLKTVRLQYSSASNTWSFDREELRRVLSPKTKVILLNTPHNPTGKVFTRHEMETVLETIQDRPQITVVTDEVYEHLVYGDAVHVPFAQLDGAFDRTVTISSTGKTFASTGWKIGYAVGPTSLIGHLHTVLKASVFSVHSATQMGFVQAIAHAQATGYFASLQESYARKRELLLETLEKLPGIQIMAPEGGFFVVADCANLQLPEPYASGPRNASLCRYFVQEIGVTAIPLGVFYNSQNHRDAEEYIRFAFCKQDASIQEACRRLESKLCL